MNFFELIKMRESCRSYDESREVEEEKLQKILEAAVLSPSACNGQPYHFTVCRGEKAKQVAAATHGLGLNKFAAEAPVQIVISEKPYIKSAAMGAKVSKNDYRSMDIGIAVAYLTAAATEVGLSTCILGWFDGSKVRDLCGLDGMVRLVVCLGYAKDEKLREKKRKPMEELVSYMD